MIKQDSLKKSNLSEILILITFMLSASLRFLTFIKYLQYDPAGEGFSQISNHTITFSYNLDFALGNDGISLLFLRLTSFLFPSCYILCRTRNKNNFVSLSLFLFFLFSIEIILLGVFQLLDLFFFYFFFEAVLIPMFLLIGKWGSRERRMKAAYYFFRYTLITSRVVFLSLFYIYSSLGSTLYSILSDHPFSFAEESFLAVAFFITFATKIPRLPFHIWLPEAHVEAPTVGSVILAALLLKLGGFGFLRYSLPLFGNTNHSFVCIVYVIAIVSIIYASLTTTRQFDLKKIIAYSSIAHRNLAVLGLFAFTQQGLDGSVYLRLGHGIVSGALFICIGVLYDRYHTRLVRYYGGLVAVRPLFACAFFGFTLANRGFPGTVNFIGEFLIFAGIFDRNAFIAILATPAIVLSAVYSIWLYNRILFGTLRKSQGFIYRDLNRVEASVLFTFLFCTLYFGLTSSHILDTIYTGTKTITRMF